MNFRSIFASAAGAAALIAVPHAGAEGVEVRDAAARVVVIVEDRSDLDVSIEAGEVLPAPQVRLEDGRVIVDGRLDRRIRGCRGRGSDEAVDVRGIGRVEGDELTQITIRSPRQLDVELSDGVYAEIGASAGGRVDLNTCGAVSIGASEGDLSVRHRGSGGVSVEDVGGALDASMSGSGGASFARVDRDAQLRLGGSGGVQIGPIGGDLNAALSGSGGMRLGDVGGDAQVVLSGSGGFNVGDIGGRLDARATGSGGVEADNVGAGARVSVTGSGQFRAGEINGALEARTSGSGGVSLQASHGPGAHLEVTGTGSISVGGGQVERLEANSRGSGSVRFDGAAAILAVRLTGSGGIRVAEAGAVESMIDQGSGSIRIGR